MIVTRDIPYAKVGDRPLLLDLYLPQGVTKPPLVVFIHGGSWRTGSRKDCTMTWIVPKGYALASIDYRLSQEAVFPAQIFDCKGAVRWLRAHAGDYGYDATRIAIAGASAGGHLAVLLGTSGGEKELEGDVGGNLSQSSAVQAIVDFYGPTDFILRSHDQPALTDDPAGNVFQLLGQGVKADEAKARLASGAWHVTVDDPPLIIFHGTNDPKVLLNQPQRLRAAYDQLHLKSSLHLVDGAGHGGAAFDAPAIQELVSDFLRQELKPGGPGSTN